MYFQRLRLQIAFLRGHNWLQGLSYFASRRISRRSDAPCSKNLPMG